MKSVKAQEAIETSTPNLVNPYASQTVELTRTIKNNPVTFRHQIAGTSDDIWLKFVRAFNHRRIIKNGSVVYADNEQSAVRMTYKELVKEVPEGYQPFFRQELTKENFYDLIPYDDQKAIVEQAFSFEVTESESGEFFFDGETDVRLNISFPINGEVFTAEHSFQPVTKGAESEYKAATSHELPFGRYKQTETSLMADFDRLQKLFQSISLGFEGYPVAPIWHQVSLLNYLFTDFGQVTTKN